MARNKRPVVIVAAALVALIIIPLLLLVATRSGGGGKGQVPDLGGMDPGLDTAAATVDFDLRQLAEKTEQLLEGELAQALRRGDVSLDFMSSLQQESRKGAEALRRGNLERAAGHYKAVVQAAEARLAVLALADKARALEASTYAELQRLDFVKPSFANTYQEAVDAYNRGQRTLGAADYEASIDGFEMAGAILGDLEARFIQQVASLLEAGDEALAGYQLSSARSAYGKVLGLDAGNGAAQEGLDTVSALEGIADEVKTIRALEAEGKLEAALADLEALAEAHPGNPFIEEQRSSLQGRITEREYQALIDASVEAEAAGDLGAAISALEAALERMSNAAQKERLERLEVAYKAARLEILLGNGFDALKSARYEAARNFYKEAVALAPDSKEARTGLEKASSLYLANIRYTQNLAAAEKYVEEGRFPLTANLFNEAMASRPSKVSSGQEAAEARLRSTLEAQSEEVAVTLESDRRSYVSIIGVFPPERFREKELRLFPDVYKVRATRPGYEPVEKDLKVDATQPNPSLAIECTNKL